jgi:integral membrane protein
MTENYRAFQKNALAAMRAIGSAEAVSFLLLLLIAMPLKYVGHNETWVRILGPIHGGLFLLYLASALAAVWAIRWPWTYFLLAALSSVIPFGPFLFEAWLKRRSQSAENQRA